MKIASSFLLRHGLAVLTIGVLCGTVQPSYAYIIYPITTAHNRSFKSFPFPFDVEVKGRDGVKPTKVLLAIRRNKDSLYWTGAEWVPSWKERPFKPWFSMKPIGNNVWRYDGSVPTEDGSYNMAIEAFFPPASVSTEFSVWQDNIPPELTVASPSEGEVFSDLTEIKGAAVDVKFPGDAWGHHARVSLILQNPAGLYWTGSEWGDETELHIYYYNSESWSFPSWRTKALPSPPDLIDGQYLLMAKAVDGAGNITQTSRIFYINRKNG